MNAKYTPLAQHACLIVQLSVAPTVAVQKLPLINFSLPALLLRIVESEAGRSVPRAMIDYICAPVGMPLQKCVLSARQDGPLP
jgi:hypothetical protein